jgi:hypothetical protein
MSISIRQEGRKFVVYDNDEPTGRYAFTQDKADKIARRLAARARSNPLVGWSKIADFPPEMIDRTTRPLLSKSAPKIYAEKLKTTLLDLHVVLGISQPLPPYLDPTTKQYTGGVNPRSLPDWPTVNALTADGRTVLWVPITLKEAFIRTALFEGRPDSLEHFIERHPGSSANLAPMTPFTLLHRMGDTIRAQRAKEVFDIRRPFDDLTEKYRSVGISYSKRDADLYSVGVDTFAGRQRLFREAGEPLSDLWAKYILTGRIAYDPEAPPVTFDAWYDFELEARRQYAKKIHDYFPRWLEQSRGQVFAITLEQRST